MKRLRAEKHTDAKKKESEKAKGEGKAERGDMERTGVGGQI